ncbi:NTP transferase domain-containing protein [candidate division WOR-3 bacterium]|nr:NTP transferase domain-containing protein [candidate division WOR-3 bacterium]
MKSDKPKSLMDMAGYPMLGYVLNCAKSLNPDKIVVVVGKGGGLIIDRFKGENVEFVTQNPQLGTAHAVLQTEKQVEKKGKILILYGDVPLVRSQTLSNFIVDSTGYKASFLGMRLENPGSYGRFVTEGKLLKAIREARDADEKEKQIKVVNTGIMICESETLFEAISEVKTDNDQKEYYLTDVVKILDKKGLKVSYSIASNPSEFFGANDRSEIAVLSSIIRNEKMSSLMKEGVTIISPENTVIDFQVRIGRGTVVYPFSFITGNTEIGKNCVVKPFSFLKDCMLQDGETS